MPNVVSGPPNDSKESKDEWGKYERPGDIKHMKCHDIFCAIIFVLILGGMIAILILGILKGKLWSLYNSWDSSGQYCGIDNSKLISEVTNPSNFTFFNLTEYPYLFFDAWDPKIQICVKECPTENDMTDVFLAKTVPAILLNLSYLSPNDYSTVYYPTANTVLQYKSKQLFNRCMPDVNTADIINSTQFIDAFNSMINSIPALATSLSSVYQLWKKIIICAAGSLIIAFLWVLLLKFITGFIVYLVVFLVPLALIGLGVWLFFRGGVMTTLKTIKTGSTLKSNEIVAIVLWSVAFIFFLIILFVWKKLKQSITVLKISSKALGANWTIIFSPIIAMIIAILFWAAVIISSIYIYTSSEFEIVNDKMIFYLNKTHQYLLIYNLVFFIFISVQVYFTNYYAMSTSIVEWYFSGQKSFGCGCSCWRGYFYAFTKSLGTITIASVIMTPLILLILFLEYLDQKAKRGNAPTFVQFLIKCLQCCLWCFTKIIGYLNKSLFTASQVFNTNWWHSAGIITDIVLSDIISTSLLNGISFFIMFLSKVVIGCITAFLFCLWIYHTETNTVGFLLSGCIVFFSSYVISSFILSAYENVIDIVFICYQGENSIPGYSASENTKEVKKTIEEMKEHYESESPKVASNDHEMKDITETQHK